MREGLLKPGLSTGPYLTRWSNSYTGDEVAKAVISANMEDSSEGWVRIRLGSLDQRIGLVTQPRRFGGRQWYFECPVTHRHCRVVWMPPGARRFGSRQIWGRDVVAYASQFGTPADRAELGKAKIKSRLMGDSDPDKWDLPPKPKWMRWRTYKKHIEKFDYYEEVLDGVLVNAAMRLSARGS